MASTVPVSGRHSTLSFCSKSVPEEPVSNRQALLIVAKTGQPIAVRACTGGTRSARTYLLTDHPSTTLRAGFGSVVATTDAAGTLTSQQRYLPFGAQRTNVPSPNSQSPTDFTYTGQRTLDEGMGGLMDYRARFYSPSLNRFLQPDTITPDGPQGLNRYAYVLNSPIRYNDPTGHDVGCAGRDASDCAPSTPPAPPTTPSTGNGTGDNDDHPTQLEEDLASGGGGKPQYSPAVDDGETCTLEPSYLCQLSEEDQDKIANGGSYQAYVIDSSTARHTNAVYGVLLGVPTIVLGAPEWVGLAVTYLGGFFSGEIAKLPGAQEGDVIVMVGHAVGEEFVYREHTYNTEVITNTYYFRDDKLIWTETEVTNAYPTSRTY